MFLFKTVSSIWLSSICATIAIVVACPPIDAEEHGAVRPLSPALIVTLADGARSSATFRALIEELAHSDVIVHLLGAPGHQSRRLAGTTRFVNAVAGRRYLRITVDERLPHDVRVSMLGHELQHAVEVARARWVVDTRTFESLYRHIGTEACACPHGACYETMDARRTGSRVLIEMKAAVAMAADADCPECW